MRSGTSAGTGLASGCMLLPLTITTGHGAARRQSRATGPSGALGFPTQAPVTLPARVLPRTSIAAPAARAAQRSGWVSSGTG